MPATPFGQGSAPTTEKEHFRFANRVGDAKRARSLARFDDEEAQRGIVTARSTSQGTAGNFVGFAVLRSVRERFGGHSQLDDPDHLVVHSPNGHNSFASNG